MFLIIIHYYNFIRSVVLEDVNLFNSGNTFITRLSISFHIFLRIHVSSKYSLLHYRMIILLLHLLFIYSVYAVYIAFLNSRPAYRHRDASRRVAHRDGGGFARLSRGRGRIMAWSTRY